MSESSINTNNLTTLPQTEEEWRRAMTEYEQANDLIPLPRTLEEAYMLHEASENDYSNLIDDYEDYLNGYDDDFDESEVSDDEEFPPRENSPVSILDHPNLLD